MVDACYRALRRLPGPDFHRLGPCSFQDAPWVHLIAWPVDDKGVASIAAVSMVMDHFGNPGTSLLTMREEHPYAGFWIRLFARTIDLILILAAFHLFSLGDRMGADAGLPGPERIRRGFLVRGICAKSHSPAVRSLIPLFRKIVTKRTI